MLCVKRYLLNYTISTTVFVKPLKQPKGLIHLTALVTELKNVAYPLNGILCRNENDGIQAIRTCTIPMTDKISSEKSSIYHLYISHIRIM